MKKILLLILFCLVTSITIIAQDDQYVDLGLSVKWATCNLGATSPEQFGYYYAWGETTPRTAPGWNYTWKTTPWRNSGGPGYLVDFDKYNLKDYKRVLEPTDDAATQLLGSHWRMPTYEEAKELIEKSKITWVTLNGINGFKITGPNGNSIFLPAAGQREQKKIKKENIVGEYWTSLRKEHSFVAGSREEVGSWANSYIIYLEYKEKKANL